ncbi:MAG: malto-oligosyltrehalose synthase [Deltaproteobacteria bacterium]|nr:MAG: malto-oligosyltrehalose synthase [Deltaproteobacteria bacterium]
MASDEINYRRFFDVNALAAIRVEDPEVFQATHDLLLRFIRRGWVTGIRVDHVDGLYDPRQYLQNLQDGARRVREEGGTPPSGGDRPLYVVVKKILGREEHLSPRWLAHGTTGYDFLNIVNGIFVDPAGASAMDGIYARFKGRDEDVRELLATCKKLIMLVSMSGELHVLACGLDRISEQHRWSRDFTLEGQRFGLREVIARFPVYRSYVREESPVVSKEDRKNILSAVRTAKKRSPTVHESLFDFISQVWLQDPPQGLEAAAIEERRRFVMRLQQYTGPVMAKGLEDTFHYRHVPLASLNEVGCEVPWRRVTLRDFHDRNFERQRLWPHSLLATSTHDTKRGEDVRTRLDALSERPEAWEKAVLRWREMTQGLKTEIEEIRVPDTNDEYLLYQTLVGAWPPGPDTASSRAAFASRVEEYMIKAAREAKVHSSWFNVNVPYEEALRKFVRGALEFRPDNRFSDDLQEFMAPVIRAGMRTSLSQVLLKAASPGVPDFYQGAELWDLNLVDPDNRRPVDFDLRRRLLETLQPEGVALAASLLAQPDDGRIKMYVMRTVLRFRRERRPLFDHGAYASLEANGPRADHVCAFARMHQGKSALAVAGRFFLRLGGDGPEIWKGTNLALPGPLAGSAWRDAFTGRTIRDEGGGLPVSEVLSIIPVALLERLT